MQRMSGRAYRAFILAASVLPAVAVAVAVVLLWNSAVGVRDLAILVVAYTLTGLGVTVGYHRLLTHRSFETPRAVRFTFALLGTMAAEGPPITWVAHHRQHHAFADEEGDPHSPHHHGGGWRGALGGLWHAHLGWLLDDRLGSSALRYAPDLVREPEMRWLSRHFLGVVAAGLLLPGVAGLALSGTLAGFATGVLWGGLVRMFLLHHATYAINSICHVYGRRRYDVTDRSGNVAWLAIPSFGESWHNNHHAFPTAARHGARPWEVDLSALVIRALEAVGLASEVVRVPEDRRTAKVTRERAAQ
jgi:stearoyl-CoA desaturase (delta-9 desaturase)